MTLQRSRRELLENVGFSSAVSLLVKLRGILILPIISRAAGTADYGIWVQVTALVALFPPLFGLNLHSAITRFGLNATEQVARSLLQQVTLVVIALSCTGALALTGLLELLDLQNPKQHSLLLICIWLAPPVAVCKLGIAHVRGRGQVKSASLLEAALQLSAVGAAAIAFAQHQGIHGALLALISVFSVFAVSMTLPKLRVWSAAQRTALARPATRCSSRPTSPASMTTYLRYALPTIPAAIADWSLFASDRYALGILVDNSAAGIYSATYSIALLMRLLGAPIAYALLPAVGKLWDRNRRAEAIQLTRDAALLSVVTSVLAAVLLTRNGAWLLEQLSTPEISQGSIPLLPYLTSGLVLWTITRVFIQLFVAEKRTGDMAKVLVSSAVLNLACNLLLIPVMGAKGAALATLIAYAFAFGHTLLRLRKTLRLSFRSMAALRLSCCLAAILVALLVVPQQSSWLGVITEGLCFTLGFAGLLLATGTVALPKGSKN